MSPKEREHKPNQTENGTQFSRQIPGLVEKSIRGPADKARRAQKQLIEGVAQQPFYDDVLVVIAQVQRLMLSPHQSTQGINRATAFMGDFLYETGTGLPEEGRIKRVNLTPRIIQIVREIKENDEKLRAKPFIESQLTGNYEAMIRDGLPMIQDAIDKESQGVVITFTRPARPDEDLTKRQEERRKWQEWVNRYNSFLPKLNDPEAEGVQDDLINLLRVEPEQTIFPEGKFFTSRYCGLSFAEIARLPSPAALADLSRITVYLTAILKDNPSESRLEILRTLFFDPITFIDPSKRMSFRNRNLLANLNLWQEYFFQTIVYEQEPDREHETLELLRAIPEPLTARMAPNLFQWAVYPLEKDPDFSGDISDRINYHLFAYQARDQYRRDHQGELYAAKGMDEIAQEYFQNVILPTFQQRLEKFGLLAKFQQGVNIINQAVEAIPYEKQHLSTIRATFERNCGEEFLARLERQKAEIGEVTKYVWQEMTRQGKVHFLPLQQGVDVIEFSKDSTPSILGIESVILNTAGQVQDWQVNIGFTLQDTYISVMGQLDQEGKLHLRAPFEQETPGLYTVLNHIAVLTFHDLITQEERARSPRENGETAVIGESKTKPKSPKRQQQQSSDSGLPRKQTDRHLIETVSRKTGYTPRKVTIHRAYLPYAQTYETAINLHHEALKNHEAQQTEASRMVLEWAKHELQEARRIFRHHPTESKLKNLPPKFDLEQIQDPLTAEKRYLRTWVVEHDSPKPTKEELESPMKLFERHYRGSSALSFLDQFTPWFIGK